MIKFHPLGTGNLSIVNLAGLSHETIIAGNAAGTNLGALGKAALDALIAADSMFRENLITARGSSLTDQIRGLDKHRATDLREIWRTANAAAKGSDTGRAEEGMKLVTFLKPYHDASKEPLMSETSTLQYMHIRYNDDTSIKDAAIKLQLDAVFASLFTANEQLSDLWNERADEEASKSGLPPSRIRSELEKCYNGFCDIVIQTIKLIPSAAVEHLFVVMNEIRIKYHRFMPVKLTDANTSVDTIPVQIYTGQAITPIPRVSVRKDDGMFYELSFTVDYYITYRNNKNIGEAKILIHGKGKYSGLYTSTFHIEEKMQNS